GVGRDHEYVRHGTLSIIAALDLQSGEISANVEPRHRSREFIALLERLHAHYPSEAVIRVALDNHSAHISKETMAYFGQPPARAMTETFHRASIRRYACHYFLLVRGRAVCFHQGDFRIRTFMVHKC